MRAERIRILGERILIQLVHINLLSITAGRYLQQLLASRDDGTILLQSDLMTSLPTFREVIILLTMCSLCIMKGV